MATKQSSNEQPRPLEEVQPFSWDCRCASCTDGDPDTWHWKGEYEISADGTRTIWLVDADDPEHAFHIDLPPEVILARVQEGRRD